MHACMWPSVMMLIFLLSLYGWALSLKAVTATGFIWSRYSFVITPVNYNLFSVNAFMAVTGSYQLWRKYSSESAKKE